MIDYCTKENLYLFVDALKKAVGVNPEVIGIDSFNVCKRIRGLVVQPVDFSDRSLRGMSIPKESIILLNSNRTKEERNFDCSHELIHVVKHIDADHQTFNCFDKRRPNQNSYLEWQANEGAAEFLVPYRVFIPLFCEGVRNCRNVHDYEVLKESLAHTFYVPVTVITLRIENLKYEIQQYQNGCSINSLDILSTAKQEQNNIYITSYNVFFSFCEYLA